MVDIDSLKNSQINQKREKYSHELYWCDLDKSKFLSLLFASSFISRTCFHPFGLIKIRLQTGKTGAISTLHIVKQVWHNEGFSRGFYRGFPISLGSLLFEPIFTISLEQTRTILKTNQPNYITHSQWNILTNLISSGLATFIYQSFTTPIDVITQRIMITRARDGIHMIDVIRDIYLKSGDGIQGFYKGYFVSLTMSLPFNSILWTFYWKIQSKLEQIIPFRYDSFVSPLSASSASLLTSLLTQPIDVIKTRLQVSQKRQSIRKTCLILIHERGFKGFFSGSSPRICTIVPYTIIMMSLYEFIKRISVR
ncbi:hypothetical protein I4U23_016687 [Adineta vaga]|nr:hypothetical protein I4U23_016687 [Adineta vaga]